MGKTLCDWSKKDIERDAEALARLVSSPRFYCRKCARAAGFAKVLCKPRRLPETQSETASSSPLDGG